MIRILTPKGHKVLFDEVDWETYQSRSWYVATTGYLVSFKNKATTLFHRLLVQGERVDHINGNKLDNRRCNLRSCIHRENIRNMRKHADARTSRYKGVSKDPERPGQWKAQLTADGVSRLAKRFRTEEEAARAYDEAARKWFGEFARPNFPTEEEENQIA